MFNYKTDTPNKALYERSAYLNNAKFSKMLEISTAHSKDNKPIILIDTGSALSDYVLSKWTTAINLNFNEKYGKLLDSNLSLSDQYRRSYKNENLTADDIKLQDSGNAQVIDFVASKVVK